MADEEKQKSTQTQSEEQGGARPFPTPTRHPASVRVFALVVGINDYAGGIPPLNGCLKDVDLVTGYLREKFGNPEQPASTKTLGPDITVEANGRLHLCTLTEQQATYDNIIRGFREHLSQATETDTVWFHFSGHGSEQYTALEFKAIDPNGKDQTLVCYRDENNANAQLFLADKELAVLLHEVSKKKPHIVVSLDSCHSGSGTREMMDPAGVKPRAFRFLQSADREDPALLPNVSAVRAFDSYLGGYYKNLSSIEIPPAEHVLLSGCESVQTAGDTAQGGVFTTSLIQVLNDATGPIHYASLFTKARARASRKRGAQTPQFETIDGFDPYTSFLIGEPMADIPEHYEVFPMGFDGLQPKWFVRCGAIHGLPTGQPDLIKLMISSDNSDNPEKIGAHIDKVGAQHSHIILAEGAFLDPDGEYYAEVLAMPAAPIYVELTGENTSAIGTLKAAWDASKNILLADGETETPALSVEATAGDSFIIRDAHSGKTFVEVPREAGNAEQRAELVKQNLDKIARWKRMITLDNPDTQIRDLFDFELLIQDKNRQDTAYQSEEVKIYVSEDNLQIYPNGNGFLGVNFRVTLREARQDLFFYAFDLSSSCAIKFRSDEEKVLRGDSVNPGDTMLLSNRHYGWGLGPNDDEAVRWFKLLVTTEELDYHQLQQPGLSGTREVEMEAFNPEKISEDWCAQTIKVHLVRERGKVPGAGDAPAVLAGGRLQVKGHAGVEARIALSSAHAGERSNDSANRLAALDMEGCHMVAFNPSSSQARQNVMELARVQVEDPATLNDTPLEVILADKLAEGELLLPIAFDGQHFRVVGDAVAEGDETAVRIRELPEAGPAGGANPFGEEPADPSLFKALKMAFFRVALERDEAGKVVYPEPWTKWVKNLP